MRWRFVSGWVLGLCAPVFAGCAVNELGFVRVRRDHREDCTVVQLKSFGLHVSTLPEDAGASLGWTCRTYVVPNDRCAKNGQGGIGEPLAFSVRCTGIVLNTNRNHVGVTIGLSNRACVLVPDEDDGILAIQYDSKDPLNWRLYTMEYR
jgi:hypothetical protein